MQSLGRLLTVSSDDGSSSVTLQDLHIQNGNSLGHSLQKTLENFNTVDFSNVSAHQVTESALGGALCIFGAALHLQNVRRTVMETLMLKTPSIEYQYIAVAHVCGFVAGQVFRLLWCTWGRRVFGGT